MLKLIKSIGTFNAPLLTKCFFVKSGLSNAITFYKVLKWLQKLNTGRLSGIRTGYGWMIGGFVFVKAYSNRPGTTWSGVFFIVLCYTLDETESRWLK